MKRIFFIFLTASAMLSCGKHDPESKGGPKEPEEAIDWKAAASSAQTALETWFWRGPEHNYYWIDNRYDDNTFYHYWQTAHAMECLMDAYERTGDVFYKDRVRTVLARIKESTGGRYINQYYDDMAWMGLACLRAYNLFSEEEYLNAVNILWEDVQGGWAEPDGGMLWNKIEADAAKRNSCTHWTVACFGARMAAMTKAKKDLDFAVKVYDYAYDSGLYNYISGAAVDQLGGSVYTTYNQGVLIGSSLELYDLTQRDEYLSTALKCARFCMSNDKFAKSGIWRDEGATEGRNKNNGIFKGILAHYLKDLIKSPNLDDEQALRRALVRYMEKMGRSLHEAAKSDWLFPGDWTRGAEPGERIYLGCQLSGVILMECLAMYMDEYPEMME